MADNQPAQDIVALALADMLAEISARYGVTDVDIQIATLKALADDTGNISLVSRDIIETTFLAEVKKRGN